VSEPVELAERAASLGMSLDSVRRLLGCEQFVARKTDKPWRPKSIGPDHHIRKHPRMNTHYIVFTINNRRQSINGAATIEETRLIRDAHFKALGINQ
jgi:hypothetical protein